MSEKSNLPETHAGLAAPIGSAIPAGKDGWTADYKFVEKVAAAVRKKSGTHLYYEVVDDVIIALHDMGYVKVSPNDQSQAALTGSDDEKH